MKHFLSEDEAEAETGGSLTEELASLQTEVLDRLYGTAVDPDTLGDLVEHWETLVRPNRRRPSHIRQAVLERAGVIRHVARLEQVLERTLTVRSAPPDQDKVLRLRRTPAFSTDGTGVIHSANDAARSTIGAVAGMALTALPFHPEDMARLAAEVRDLISDGAEARERHEDAASTRLIRARRCRDDRLVFLHLRLMEDAQPLRQVLVLSSDMSWSDQAYKLLTDAFGLTPAEADVVASLTECGSVKDIAARRGRSVETVRSQMKSILAKTEARNQSDLMRLTISLSDLALLPGSEAMPSRQDTVGPRISRGGQQLIARRYHSIARPDGRIVDYLEFGDPDGRPVINTGSNFGYCRWAAQAEEKAGDLGMRVISPIRAGFGGSTPLPQGADRLSAVAEDYAALMDHLQIAQAHFVVVDADLMFVARLNTLFPGRIAGVLGCAMALPFSKAAQFDRMGPWHRFILGTSRYVPQMLPFLARAGFAMARSLGKPGFIRKVYAGSPADCALSRDPLAMEAVESGTDVVLTADFDASRHYATEMLTVHAHGWAEDVPRLLDAVPVIDLVGTEDQSMPPETVRELTEAYPQVSFRSVDRAGNFLIFQKWPLMLATLEEMMTEAAAKTEVGT
ncbi:hypothetical protein ACRARG_16685 [Pseudooceanicola sp. C21-150M6]|uniref:hypothetical protein n=1 Tax=Pseudooceanicola sp. C21-150M6 TaxID=3434355 RepID=UPI003D7F2D99